MEEVKMHKTPSPCLSCTRVAAPRNCENKHCRMWREWFVLEWDRVRTFPRKAAEQAKPKPLGVSVGGRSYPHPEQIKDYLALDPCTKCLCPKDLCATPCRVRRAWLEANKEAKR